MTALLAWITACTEREVAEGASVHQDLFLNAYDAFTQTGQCPEEPLWSETPRDWLDSRVMVDVLTGDGWSHTSVAVTRGFDFNCLGGISENFDWYEAEGLWFFWSHVLVAEGPVMQMGETSRMFHAFEAADDDVPGWLCIDSFEPVDSTESGPGVATGSFEVLVGPYDVVFGTFSSADCITAEDAWGEIWQCDGLDNDADGVIDEGAPDRNGNGVPDCQEE